jgi:hypothetical protein
MHRPHPLQMLVSIFGIVSKPVNAKVGYEGFYSVTTDVYYKWSYFSNIYIALPYSLNPTGP